MPRERSILAPGGGPCQSGRFRSGVGFCLTLWRAPSGVTGRRFGGDCRVRGTEAAPLAVKAASEKRDKDSRWAIPIPPKGDRQWLSASGDRLQGESSPWTLDLLARSSALAVPFAAPPQGAFLRSLRRHRPGRGLQDNQRLPPPVEDVRQDIGGAGVGRAAAH